MRSFFALLPVCALLFIAPAPVSAQNNDMRGVMSRLDQMQRQVDLISRQVYKGDVPADAIRSGNIGGDTANLAAAMDERLAGLEASIRQLNNRIDEQNHAFGQLKQEFDIFKSDTEVRLNEMSQGGMNQQSGAMSSSSSSSPSAALPVDTNSATAAMATQNDSPATAGDVRDLPSNNAAALYDAAFQALREQKYDRAEAGFKKFLDEHGNDALAGNAQYWLGETYYVRGNYAEAAKVFATGYQKYPQSGKAPDNLLKLGLSLAQAGKKEDACVTLQQLRKQYSNAAAVIKQRAEDEQKKLNCGITG